MTDDPTEVPEAEAPDGRTVPPSGNVEEAPDDGADEVDDEDQEPADLGEELEEGESA